MDRISTTHYLKQFEKHQANSPCHDAVFAYRQEAMAQFLAQGFPTRQLEEWKYCSLYGLSEQSFNGPHALDEQKDAPSLADCVTIRPGATPAIPGVRILSLATLLQDPPSWLRDYIALRDVQPHAMTALNQAFLQDGLVVVVAPGVKVDQPLHLPYQTQDNEFRPLCHFILAGEGSSIAVIEHYQGQENGGSFTQIETICDLAPAANVRHYKVLQAGRGNTHLDTTRIQQSRDSQYNGVNFALSGDLLRNDTVVSLNASGAQANLAGLSVASGQQVYDQHTAIFHQAPHTHSHQLYKGIASDRGRVVFNGKIRVAKDAQRVTSDLQSKHLLLSNQAEIDSKPELEIFADDVKCSHGATIGELDPEALYYCQSRGIPYKIAQQMLLQGFVDEIIDRVDVLALRQFLAMRYEAKLGHLEEDECKT